MKNSLLLSIFLLFRFLAAAQTGLEVRGYGGVSGAMANWNIDLDGASSVTIKNYKEVGILLSKGIGEKFSITGGVIYSFANVEYSPNFPLCVNCQYEYVHNSSFRLLSIPVYAEYALGKIFYTAAGPIVDFHLTQRNNFSDQSGVGYLVGFGAKLDIQNLSFSIFPNYKRHNVIPFVKEGNYKQVLHELGIQLGVGYSF